MDSNVRKLVEEGLRHYSEGQIMAALAAWQRALALDPHCVPAREYHDYVMENFDRLCAEIESGTFRSSALEGELPTMETQVPSLGPDGRITHLTRSSRSTLERWPLKIQEDSARAPGVPSASPRQYGRRSTKLDPAMLDGVLPPPEDDDLLDIPAAPLPGVPAAEGLGEESLGSDAAEEFDQGHRSSRPKPRPTLLGTGDTRPPISFGGAEEQPTVEVNSDSRKPPRTRTVTEDFGVPMVTPLPGLPGEGPLSVGTDPGLDTAWTLDPRPRPAPPSSRPVRHSTQTVRPRPMDLDDSDADGGGDSVRGPDSAFAPVIIEELATEESDARSDGAPRGEGADELFDALPTSRLRLEDVNAALAAALLPTDEVSVAAPRDEIAQYELLAQAVLMELEEEGEEGESEAARLRRRVTALIDRAQAEHRHGDDEMAVVALDLAVLENPDSVITQKLMYMHHDDICAVFRSYLGDESAVPKLTMPLHELASQNLDSRAAFLLSRVDGVMTMSELLDVSGMPLIDAYRYLAVTVLRGIVRLSR